MNRILKFRAWDGEEMIILKNSGLQYYDFEGSYSLGFTVDGYNGFWAHEQYESATEKASKFPIMQFTGLDDIKAIEIYESDILSATPKSKSGTTLIGKVEYNHMGMFAFVYGDNYEKYFNIQALKTYYDIEVIGNIHKNPELL